MENLLTMMNTIQSFFVDFDVFFLIGIFALALLYLSTLGKDHGVVLTIALYLSIGTVMFLPFLSDIQFAGMASYQLSLVFFLLFIPAFTFLQLRNGFFEPSIVPSGWERGVFAVIFSGACFFVMLSFFPPEIQRELSPVIQTLFLRQPWSNLWFSLPILTLLFLKGDA